MSRAARRGAATAPNFIHLDAPGRGVPAAGHIALVPGGEAPLLALQLPPGLQGAAREQVAWRQLQDQLGLGRDQVEMRPYCGTDKAASWTRALVAGTDLMRRWRAALDPGCRALLPDYLALPASADLWVLAVQGDRLQGRLGLMDGFSSELELARLMLTQMLADAELEKPKAVLLLEGAFPGLEALLADYEIALVDKASGLKSLGIADPVVLGHGELAADLRIDARAARHQLRRQLLPWGTALLAAGLMVGIWAVGEGLKLRELHRERAALQGNVERLVRDHFVPGGPLLDVRLQVSRALAARQAEITAGSGRVSPLLLIGQVADVMVGFGVQPEVLNYSQDAGLGLELRLEDFAALDRLVAALERAGLVAERRAARVVEDGVGGVRAELHVQVKQAEAGQQ